MFLVGIGFFILFLVIVIAILYFLHTQKRYTQPAEESEDEQFIEEEEGLDEQPQRVNSRNLSTQPTFDRRNVNSQQDVHQERDVQNGKETPKERTKDQPRGYACRTKTA